MLSTVALPGQDAFRPQIKHAHVVEESSRDPTIGLVVDRTRAEPAPGYEGYFPLPVHGYYRLDEASGHEVMIFYEDGWLRLLEFVPNPAWETPSEFPPPEQMDVWTSEGPDAWFRK